MLFNSAPFAVFFVVVFVLYHRLRRREQNAMLLVASYVFYGWWDWRLCGLLAFSTLLDYTCALGMHARPRHRRAFLLTSICGNLGVLGVFKYAGFFVESAATALRALGVHADVAPLAIVLPVGISFYTFQTMAYTIDVYRGRMQPTRDLGLVALYVAYFPQLVAGPIERAQAMFPQFERERTVNSEKLAGGVMLILIGLFRKVAIGDAAAEIVDVSFSLAGTESALHLYVGMCMFSLQIYCDFAGYSDIARGVSRLLGIELMENFRRPYFAADIADFWRRWHISLSTWLRDYLYIPLGGNRHGRLATYRNLMLTMLLGGLWHGASWTFVAWGALHGLYLAVHKALARVTHRTQRAHRAHGASGASGAHGARDASGTRGAPGHGRLRRFVGTVAVFHLVAVTWVFFRAPDFATARAYIEGMFTLRSGPVVPRALLAEAALLWMLALAIDWPQHRSGDEVVMLRWNAVVRGLACAAMVIAIIVLRPNREIPFIYFQF